MRLEMLQKQFSQRIPDLAAIPYWERLKKFKIYSVERRFQRYSIIYIWKILENLVDNYGIKWSWNNRRGRMIDVPKRAPEKNTLANNLRDQSLSVRGGKVFNKLPVHIRNSVGITMDTFKKRLDGYLQTIPDHL